MKKERIPLINDPERLREGAAEKGEFFAEHGKPQASPFYSAELTAAFHAGYERELVRQKKPRPPFLPLVADVRAKHVTPAIQALRYRLRGVKRDPAR